MGEEGRAGREGEREREGDRERGRAGGGGGHLYAAQDHAATEILDSVEHVRSRNARGEQIDELLSAVRVSAHHPTIFLVDIASDARHCARQHQRVHQSDAAARCLQDAERASDNNKKLMM
jgi:hypothetical protein